VKPSPDRGLTLVITDSGNVQPLDRLYRGADASTDVLSFPAEQEATREGGVSVEPAFVTPDEPLCARMGRCQDEILLESRNSREAEV
jgi:ssRNA-specific RNase YbeY (16S rRNA maturation enzyme)